MKREKGKKPKPKGKLPKLTVSPPKSFNININLFTAKLPDDQLEQVAEKICEIVKNQQVRK